MSQTRTPEIDRLYQEVLEYRSTKDFGALLEFVARFRHIAPYNAMLVHMQKPGSVYIASASDWESRFNRKVKPGARPLVILKPFGPVSFVFEYNDTEGTPLPDELIHPFRAEKPATPRQLSSLLRCVACDGIEVQRQPYGTHLAGLLQYTKEEKLLDVKLRLREYTVRSHYSIVLNTNSDVSEQYTTLLHELGHYYCGHLNNGQDRWLPTRPYLDKEQKEFEAETVCWIICERMGIKSPSARYLSGYLKDNQMIPDVSVDAILKAAGMAETLVSGAAKPRKELIVAQRPKQVSLFEN